MTYRENAAPPPCAECERRKARGVWRFVEPTRGDDVTGIVWAAWFLGNIVGALVLATSACGYITGEGWCVRAFVVAVATLALSWAIYCAGYLRRVEVES